MFAVDDFVLWFAWYFAEDLATHPSTAKLMEKAGIAISGEPPPTVVEHPEAALDWLADPERRNGPLMIAHPPSTAERRPSSAERRSPTAKPGVEPPAPGPRTVFEITR